MMSYPYDDITKKYERIRQRQRQDMIIGIVAITLISVAFFLAAAAMMIGANCAGM